jgi:hypothetical protein
MALHVFLLNIWQQWANFSPKKEKKPLYLSQGSFFSSPGCEISPKKITVLQY